jgi:hypothetical protein
MFYVYIILRNILSSNQSSNNVEVAMILYIFFSLLHPYSGARSSIGAQGWLLSFLIFHRRQDSLDGWSARRKDST